MLIPGTELIDVIELAQDAAVYGSRVRGWRVETRGTQVAPLVVGSRPQVEAQLRHAMAELVARHASHRTGSLAQRIASPAPTIELSAASAPGEPSCLDLRATAAGQTVALRLPVAGAWSISAPAYVFDCDGRLDGGAAEVGR